jgi:hypothetical protein
MEAAYMVLSVHEWSSDVNFGLINIKMKLSETFVQVKSENFGLIS